MTDAPALGNPGGHADDHGEGYRGPATLVVDGRYVPVEVHLDARHEPHDGRMHWFGRLRLASGLPEDVHEALGAPGAHVEITAGGPRVAARIGERDLWGRYRVTGVGPPPYRLVEPDLGD